METPQTVKEKLHDPAFLKHCVDLLVSQQLGIELEWERSDVRNGKGLSAADASHFQFLQRLPEIYPEILEKNAKRTAKYARQLAKLLNNEPILVTLPVRQYQILEG